MLSTLTRRVISSLTCAHPVRLIIMTSRSLSTTSPRSSYMINPTDLHTLLLRDPTSSFRKITGHLHGKTSGRAQDPLPHRVIPLCATWYLPNDPQNRTGAKDFEACRIPTARFFDLDEVSDTDSPYPHMLPSADTFSSAMQELGITKEDHVVVYDGKDNGLFSAPRVGWTFRVMGHERVQVLNSFKMWVDELFPTAGGEARGETWSKTEYPVPKIKREMVAAYEQVHDLVDSARKEKHVETQILDARPYPRWTGEAEEPRKGLSSGHMPGSISVAFSDLVDPNTKRLYPPEKLKRVLEGKGVDPGKPIINSCGTGVTAAVIEAALIEAGFGDEKQRRLYDGSWTEWAQRAKDEEGMIIKGKESF